MPANSKIVTLTRPHESLSPELREFLDAVVVPALVRKYLPELEEVKTLASANRPAAYSLPSTFSAKRQGRNH
jgi:hypothetical protein